MKPNILITLPKYVSRAGEFYEFPLGIACIAGALRAAGHDIVCINPNHHDETAAEQIARAVAQHDIDIVLTGGFSTHYRAVKQVLDGARAARPGIITAAGGSLITSEPEIVSRGLALTAGVVGEGERTIVELVDALASGSPIGNIPGLVIPGDGGAHIRTPDRPFERKLGSLPLPDYTGFEIETYLDLQRPDDRQYLYPLEKPRFMYAVSSRACPFGCTFCFPMFGREIRKRPLDHFFAEVDMLVEKFGINILGVFDALFDTSESNVIEFCARMKQYNIKWLIQSRPGSLDERRLAILKDAGVFAILYGLESASDTILAKMKKATRVAQIEDALALSRRMGIRILGEFIFGHPAETEHTANETLDWWLNNNRYQIDMGHVYPFPGCEDYNHCVSAGLIPDPLEYIAQGCRPVNMTEMPDETWRAVFDKISDFGNNRATFGEILSIQKEKPDDVKGAMAFTINANCPHCGAANSFQHYHIATFTGTIKYPFSCTTVTCLACNQGFGLRTDDIYLKCPNMDAKRAFIKSVRRS